MAMEFRLLGDVEVRVDGRLVDIGHARQRCVLAALLVDAGRPVPADQLLDRVWADHLPRRAPTALAGYLSRLRQVLSATGDVIITRRPGGYVLTADPLAVDLHRFRDLAAQARAAGDDDKATALFAQALDLWRGEPFATLDTPWINAVRAALNAERRAAELDRNDLVLDHGGGAGLLGELSDRAAADPLNERLAGQLLLALYRGGRQADALEHYEQVRRRLAEELGADPSPPLRRLHSAILRQDSTLDATADDLTHLPVPLTTFVGREADLAELRTLLATHRLVTVTGVGGAGKSRLALEAARAGVPDHPDGTWLIELAALTQPGLTQPGLVVHLVASALGVPEHPRRPLVDLLAERLRTAEALLVLDNCEHLLDEVAGLAHTLLAAGAGLRILATSRERLGITGEVLWPISGLAEADAVRLLAERAAAVDPGFRLHAGTAAAAAQICRRLDGLPLAIELAAAGVPALGVEHIAARLDDRFRLLTRGSRDALARHQTLRAAVDWSYELLDEAERRLFNRLAVFVGGFTLDAVEAVCAEPGENAAGLLARLVDKSLVAAGTAGPATRRFRMLETLRAYGLERLREGGEADQLGDRHAAFVLALVQASRPALRGAQQTARLHQLETEHGNIRAALAWSHERGDATTAVRLAGALYPLWDRHGHYGEGRQWLAQVLAMAGPVPETARARALDAAAGLAAIQGDLRHAIAAGEQAVELCRRAGDTAGLTRALLTLGFAVVYTGDLDGGTARLDTALRYARTAGDRWLESWALLYLALIALARAGYGEAAELGAECEAKLGPDGDPECLAWARILRAAAAWRQADTETATRPLYPGLQGFQDLGHLWGLSVGLFIAGQLAGAAGDNEQMAVLLGASEKLRDSVGAALLPFVKPWLDTAVGRARTVLGAEAFSRAWQAGQALTPAAATATALRQTDALSRITERTGVGLSDQTDG